ncbi:MAG: EamA family transporter [Paludibacter sp.]|nr:EamA family transporter [Bacteroidales bacterium]MCM1068624.1 EamA family transporter [Prevotella sp.]MCM1353288.1 EamA family transporter [Bacteroides sp.]MCM1442304.1 EamA family transporter [Muribaculum sp.]MCM1481123.1 EamA family transporter [Paludibacter sp.]
MWIVLAILSALCLGFYDVSKKQSLQNNSVPMVLFLSVLCSSLLLLPCLLLSRLMPDAMVGTLLYVPVTDVHTHILIFLKSTLVLASWVFAYIAMKHLPITIVSPVNATRPMWTLLGAVLLFSETLNGWQWAGILVALGSFWAFSVVGQREGIRYKHNRYIYALLLATLLGAASGLYDKYLMKNLDHMVVQVYYTLYQTILMGFVCMVFRFKTGKMSFHFTWWIAGISVFLVLSDFVYLLALSYPDSLISVVSLVRRSGVVIPFLYGALVLHDSNLRAKTICLLGVLQGMIFLLIGTL